jgi:hypothetical protein
MVKRLGAWECACGFDIQFLPQASPITASILTDSRAVRGFEDYMSEGYADEVRYRGELRRA